MSGYYSMRNKKKKHLKVKRELEEKRVKAMKLLEAEMAVESRLGETVRVFLGNRPGNRYEGYKMVEDYENTFVIGGSVLDQFSTPYPMIIVKGVNKKYDERLIPKNLKVRILLLEKND